MQRWWRRSWRRGRRRRRRWRMRRRRRRRRTTVINLTTLTWQVGEKTSIATNTSWILWRLHGVVHVASLRGANQKQQQWKRRWSEHDQLRRPLSLSLSAILRMLTNTLTVCHMTRTNWALSTAKPNICHDVFSKSMFNIRHMMHQGVWEPYLVCR